MVGPPRPVESRYEKFMGDLRDYPTAQAYLMPGRETVETGFMARRSSRTNLKPAAISASTSVWPIWSAVCSVAPLFRGCTASRGSRS